MAYQVGCPWWSRQLLSEGLDEYDSVDELADEWGTTTRTIERWVRKHELC